MHAPYIKEEVQDVPLKVVGGTHYGRYPKISQEQTYNMIVSDGALVNYAGYMNIASLNPNGTGRGLYSSNRANIMIAVVGNAVYKIDNALAYNFLFSIATTDGEVYIAENNGNQIAITDGVNIYVYNYATGLVTVVTGASLTAAFMFNVSPGFISFQNGRFILACLNTSNWILSEFRADD